MGRFHQRRTGQNEQERRQEGEEGGHAGTGETRQEQGIGTEYFLGPGADEADEGHHHDQRPGVVSPRARPSIIWVAVSHW